MKHSRLVASIIFLITYGSLYPFNFSPARPDALVQLFSKRELFTSTSDMLGNVVLFAPLGLVLMLGWMPRWGIARSALSAVAMGFLMALVLQIVQIFLPTRDATLADVIGNVLGLLSGVLTGGFIAKYLPEMAELPTEKTIPIFLLAGLVATEWLPLVPSPDWELVKAHINLLLSTPVTLGGELWQGIGVATLAGYLMRNALRLRHSTFWLVVFVAMLTAGKLLIEDTSIHPSAPIGLVVGVLAWWLATHRSESQYHTLVWLALIVCYTASSLQPYQLSDQTSAISWLPFATMLEGSMLDNVRSLAGSLIFFGGILYVGAGTSDRLSSATLGLALWVLVVEMMQSLLKGRTADVTEPILILLVGQALARFQTVVMGRVKEIASSVALVQRHKAGSLVHWILQAGTATSLLMVGLTVLVSLPGIPYNVRELFRANASLPSLFAFSIALLWAGAGSAWLGTRLSRARSPGLQLLPLTLLVCAISLAWLWTGVTTESIEDISGSSNRFWFVTQQAVWGSAWKNVFLSINSPELISAVEHFIRYSALYAPLPIFLAVLLVLRKSPWEEVLPARKLVELLIGVVALLWLCKAIAFDWSSTDNLNELIARDGEWGWGGGGFLYALLLVICLNALLLTEAASGGSRQLAVSMPFSLAALLVGWWLLTQGLEQNVNKYGLVFSGTQFLLGEDRRHTISQVQLFFRWFSVQASATVILALGVWLGQSAIRHNLFSSLPVRYTSSAHENTNT